MDDGILVNPRANRAIIEIISCNYTLWGMAREAGLEPATDGLENHCSIQLSYSRKWLTQIPQI